MNLGSPGKRNSITDIKGILVGNAHNARMKTGVTAVICKKPTIAAVAIHGGAPGTRDTELLEPHNTVDGVDALVLSGGSAFGLDAASGVQAYLREQGRGFQIGPVNIPIVPGAILFDMINGGNKDWNRYPPYRELGFKAAQAASREFVTGTAGAGFGALVAELKGGLGSASIKLPNGITVAALIAVNALGSPMLGIDGHFRAATFERKREFGGFGLPEKLPENTDDLRIKFRDHSNGITNTTIGVVATDAVIDKAQAKRLAVAAHDGIAHAIWPAHTPLDGDLLFSLATGSSKITPNVNDWIALSAASASVVARAISNAVYEAKSEKTDLHPSWKQVYAVKHR